MKMRRFITYLYEYDRGNRGKNCGFIRVDVRERDVQMEVNMRNCLRCGEKGTIYILVKNQDEILGIEMANLPITNGKAERIISFETKNIKESGYRFEHIIGIAIRCENGGYLASNWRDDEYEALTWGNFSMIYSKEMTPSPEETPMPIPEYVEQEINELKKIESNRENNYHSCVSSEVEDIIEVRQKDNINQSSLICSENDTMEEIKLENEREDGDSVCSFSELDNIKKEKKEDNLSETICSEIDNIVETKSDHKKEELNSPYAYSEMNNSRRMQVNNQRNVNDSSTLISNNINQISYNNICENSNIISTSETYENPSPQMQYPCRKRSPKLRNLASSYSIDTINKPKVKRCSYKKITVSDIRNLPSPNWYLCNNNFLLHGFFNYNYLIIKTEKIEDKEKLYLGVPGIFEKQEKIMAMMFGFMYFESCSQEELDSEEEFEQSEDKKQPKEGDFGCWYLSLNI